MPRNPNVKLERLLSKPLPPEAITVDPASGLSNIVSAFEVERLNDVFGVNGWQCEYQIVNLDREKGEICVKCTFSAGEIKREAFGGNDNYRLGDALKGACTDALGKVCYQLGIGLDIYKTRNDFRLEKDGAPKDTGKPQYTSLSGIVTEVMHIGGDATWIQINGQTCFAKDGLSERLNGCLNNRIAVNAKWWWPDKVTPVLLITGILDIEPISAMKIPEIIEKRNKKDKNVDKSVSSEIQETETEAR
jgi:hypothetical protein